MGSRKIVTFAICTLNRANYVKSLVEQLSRQIISQLRTAEFEIVVVDNGSKDHTATTINELIFRFSNVNISYLYEPFVGLSNARNAAISFSNADWIWFFDDEVILPDNWICNLVELDLKGNFDFISVSIYSINKNELNLPFWYNINWEERINGTESGILKRQIQITGASFGVKKSVFDYIGIFDPDFGLKGTRLSLGEERELISRYTNSPYFNGCFYSDELFVYQNLMEDKLNLKYRLEREFYGGVLTAEMSDSKSISNIFQNQSSRSDFFTFLINHYQWNLRSLIINLSLISSFVLGYFFRKLIAKRTTSLNNS
ncbi:hypothetical protein GM51_4800 [freshwater metagenome]|uniref:Glycosyltransferase 2-like domain-containing protein n=1 Tax=freshwater metagenome TaxID=449393 RepID=A0A094Q9H9_9ZZZZ